MYCKRGYSCACWFGTKWSLGSWGWNFMCQSLRFKFIRLLMWNQVKLGKLGTETSCANPYALNSYDYWFETKWSLGSWGAETSCANPYASNSYGYWCETKWGLGSWELKRHVPIPTLQIHTACGLKPSEAWVAGGWNVMCQSLRFKFYKCASMQAKDVHCFNSKWLSLNRI